MAFTFRTATLWGHIEEEEAILFDMARLLDLRVPLLMELNARFYDNPTIAKESVAPLRDELLLTMRAFVVHPDAFERALKAKPASFQELAHSLRGYDILRCLASLVAVCDDALAQNTAVSCLSD